MSGGRVCRMVFRPRIALPFGPEQSLFHVLISVGLHPGRPMRVQTCFGFSPPRDCGISTGNPTEEGKSGSWAVLKGVVCGCARARVLRTH